MRSKLDDKNTDYKPPTSTKKIEVRKLHWRAESKIENNNLDYKKKALAASVENGIDKVTKVSINRYQQIFVKNGPEQRAKITFYLCDPESKSPSTSCTSLCRCCCCRL